MTKLIDANTLRENLLSLAYDDWNQGVSTTWAHAYREIADIIDNQPSVDAAHVKHGYWIFNPKDAIEMMFTLPKCSECGAESPNGGNYCPNCGADMRGEDNG